MATAPPKHDHGRKPKGYTHARQAYDVFSRAQNAALAEAKRIRSSAQWQAVRLQILNDSPLCADPEGVHQAADEIVVACEVDHIQGLIHRPDLAFDPENLQALCRECHARKSAAERQAKQGQS